MVMTMLVMMYSEEEDGEDGDEDGDGDDDGDVQ